MIDHMVWHVVHASLGEQQNIGVLCQQNAAMMCHFPTHSLGSIPLHGITIPSTYHDPDAVVRQRVRPMEECKKACMHHGSFIEHSLKVCMMPQNVPMTSHDAGKKQ